MYRRYLNNKITIDLVGLQIMVYNGKEWIEFTVTESMVGFYFSTFIFSKKEGPLIHKSLTK